MDSKPISHENIVLQCPVQIKALQYIKVKLRFNKHGIATIKGIVEPQEKLNALYNLTAQSTVKVLANVNGKQETLFVGVPIKVEISIIRDIHYIDITLYTFTVLMDYKKNSRSFQQTDNLYINIFRNIISAYPGGYVLDKGTNDRQQNRTIIQYEETDWEFLNRVASQFNCVITPAHKLENAILAVGIPYNKSSIETTDRYVFEKEIAKYMMFKENYGSWVESDMMTYILHSTAMYELGDIIVFEAVEFIVSEAEIELIGGILCGKYRLQKRDSIKRNTYYNEQLQGLSIDGKVISVEGDRMRLHLSIDKEQSVTTAYPYQFDTPYTTEGSTGAYSMPQINDNVKLYIPTHDENIAYIKVVNRTDGADNSKTQDPDTKYYGSIYGKELKMSPNDISFTATENKIFISFDENAGVTLQSDKEISINSKSNILMTCGSLSMKAKDNITLVTPDASIIIDEKVHLKG